MALTSRENHNYRGGFTWNPGIVWGTPIGPDGRVPCFELEWDDDGQAYATDRYALLSISECASTEKVIGDPDERDAARERFDDRVITLDEYRAHMDKMNGVSA
jgi:hypothetical protein